MARKGLVALEWRPHAVSLAGSCRSAPIVYEAYEQPVPLFDPAPTRGSNKALPRLCADAELRAYLARMRWDESFLAVAAASGGDC